MDVFDSAIRSKGDLAGVFEEWDREEQRVGLFIFGTLSAAFDAATGAKYGGGYGKDLNADIPWS